MDQEPKYDFQEGRVVNRASGKTIPLDEPVFILRGRDHYAREVIAHYQRLCSTDHAEAVELRLDQFRAFALRNPNRMKEPDTDRSAGNWTPTQ